MKQPGTARRFLVVTSVMWTQVVMSGIGRREIAAFIRDDRYTAAPGQFDLYRHRFGRAANEKGVTLLMTIKTVRLFVLATLVGLLAGCQERENANPFLKEKGVYSGQPDETLSDETNQKLRQRMKIQRGGSI